MSTPSTCWHRSAPASAALLLTAVLLLSTPPQVRADQGEAPAPVAAAVQGQISAGGLHTCAVLDVGTARCWGAGDQGQLGNNTLRPSTVPVTVAGLPGTVRAISAGTTHTCAVQDAGSVWCWGLAGNGQMGDGTAGPTGSWLRPAPVMVSGISGAVAVATGGFHACAILTGGAVRCWGDDGTGQLGDGSPGDKGLLSQAVALPGPAAALAAGEFHTCALLSGGTVRCWGHNGFGQLGDSTMVDRATPTPVVGLPDPADHPAIALSAGYGHTCVLLDDGTAWCAGDNTFGQLGHETPDVDPDPLVIRMGPSSTPLQVRHDADPSPHLTVSAPLEHLTAVAAGQFHTCTLVQDGQVRCWGQNGRGQLGTDPDPATDELDDSTLAVVVDGLAGATAVTAGGFHSCAVVGSAMECWGYDFHGQLGGHEPISLVPVAVTAVTGRSRVSVGTGHACAAPDTAVPEQLTVCWGDNGQGQLGAGLVASTSTIRVPVVDIASPAVLDAGNGHVCALPAASATPLCWGSGADGQLGDGGTASSSTPVGVAGSLVASTLSAGGTPSAPAVGHSCAVRTDAKVSCWGRGDAGQLGNDGTSSANTPVLVRADLDPDADEVVLDDLTGAVAVAAGGRHTCALTADQTVWCVGANDRGQLGDNTTTSRSVATRVQVDTDDDVDDPLVGVTSIAAGDAHTCAVLADGTVHCWGAGTHGQLGDGASADQVTPVQVAGITPALRAELLTLGTDHTCARLSDGRVACWGAGDRGQLGDGAGSASALPVTVQTLGPTGSDVPSDLRPIVRSVSAGDGGTCATLIDTSTVCWGSNATGLLGDGLGPTHPSFVTVKDLGPL